MWFPFLFDVLVDAEAICVLSFIILPWFGVGPSVACGISHGFGRVVQRMRERAHRNLPYGFALGLLAACPVAIYFPGWLGDLLLVLIAAVLSIAFAVIRPSLPATAAPAGIVNPRCTNEGGPRQDVEALVYATKNALTRYGSKIAEAERLAVETVLVELREALKGNTDNLITLQG
jgi:hypothetical protein